MSLFRGFADQSDEYTGGFVSIGNFDGVHLGHQRILKELVDQSRNTNSPSVVLTFDPHPIHLLRPEVAPPRLTTPERKAELIMACGVDHVIAYPTDNDLLGLDPESFFEQIVQQKLLARGLVEGPNFFFGKNRAGTIETLQQLCDSHQLSLKIVTAEKSDHGMISSSAIRKALFEGDVTAAAKQLGRPYSISGRVVSGAKRGREIGFPTANLAEVETALPADGVYACQCVLEEKQWPVAVSIGGNPTFDDAQHKVEAHLIGYEGELYGETLRVEFLSRIRAMRRFESRDDLIAQLGEDIETTINTLLQFGNEG